MKRALIGALHWRNQSPRRGERSLDYFNKRETLVIETKRDPQDVVSIADRNVETLIRERVAVQFPADGFLCEEFGQVDGTSGYTWAVDPIDGTAPFVNGLPTWCVSVAVLYGGVPVIGMSRAMVRSMLPPLAKARPFTGRNSTSTRPAPSRTPSPASVATTMSHRSGSARSLPRCSQGGQLHPQRVGSTDARLCRGRSARRLLRAAHACLGLPGRLLLVKEAGGEYLSFPTEGESLQKGHPVLASNPTVCADLLALHG
ncbi:inositol monophosphatase family protein [Sinorhizobium americanum]|uniref:inositol monophosphatase family protein n=1 Tax=Sinorhizobium americanum TaxID=194963 RepID=UPI0009337C2B|nr:inositol monophosphatase family protein [Sinorhizobium americanum]